MKKEEKDAAEDGGWVAAIAESTTAAAANYMVAGRTTFKCAAYTSGRPLQRPYASQPRPALAISRPM